MNGPRFDAMTRSLTDGLVSRRRALRPLAGGALAAALARLGVAEAAARRCLNEGKECKRDKQCCSGLCKRRTCRPAPGQANCTIKENFCREDPEIFICNDNPACRCYVTTRGTSFCGVNGDGQCAPCATNADCDAVAGAGSACVRGSGCCGGDTACFPPCPDPD